MQITQIQWDFDAWEEYCEWQQTNKTVLKRINDEHRIVYAVEKATVVVISCKGHYN